MEVSNTHDAGTLAIEAELFMAASAVRPVSANDSRLETLSEGSAEGQGA